MTLEFIRRKMFLLITIYHYSISNTDDYLVNKFDVVSII